MLPFRKKRRRADLVHLVRKFYGLNLIGLLGSFLTDVEAVKFFCLGDLFPK